MAENNKSTNNSRETRKGFMPSRRDFISGAIGTALGLGIGFFAPPLLKNLFDSPLFQPTYTVNIYSESILASYEKDKYLNEDAVKLIREQGGYLLLSTQGLSDKVNGIIDIYQSGDIIETDLPLGTASKPQSWSQGFVVRFEFLFKYKKINDLASLEHRTQTIPEEKYFITMDALRQEIIKDAAEANGKRSQYHNWRARRSKNEILPYDYQLVVDGIKYNVVGLEALTNNDKPKMENLWEIYVSNSKITQS